MTHTSKTIVFFGTDHFSVSALQCLIDEDYSVAAVVTKPDSKRGRGQKLQAPEVKVLAEAHGIRVLQPARLSDIHDELHQLMPMTGVLSSFGRIIPATILELFEGGIVNVHPSLLPLYRGPSPIESAILNGDTTAGVSLIRLTQAMDAGPIYAHTKVDLKGNETSIELYERLAALGSTLLKQHLPAILDGSLQPSEQIGDATYTPLLTKTDGQMDPTHTSAVSLERQIRAYRLYPKSTLELLGHRVTVTAAHVGTETEKPSLKCQDGQYLVIDELIAPSGKLMSGQAFLNGYAAG